MNTQKFIDWLGNTQTKKNANKIKRWFAQLCKKLKNAIHDLFAKGELNSMQMDVASLQEKKLGKLADMFLAALDESGTKVQKTTKKEAVKASEVNGDAVNQIVVLPDGTPIVWIKDNIFKGKKDHDAKIVEDYLKNNIGKVYTILESGQSVYLGKDLPGEYTYSEYSKKLQNSRSLLKAKNKAAPGLGEMIEIATNRRWNQQIIHITKMLNMEYTNMILNLHFPFMIQQVI